MQSDGKFWIVSNFVLQKLQYCILLFIFWLCSIIFLIHSTVRSKYEMLKSLSPLNGKSEADSGFQ